MRLVSSILSVVSIAILLFIQPTTTRAEELSDAQRLVHDARREWFRISNGQNEFEVSDPAMMPNLLAVAAEQSGCRYKDGIKERPARFMRFGSRRLAVVFCPAIMGTDKVFDLSKLEKPTLMELPVIEQPGGFGTTPRPGILTWDKEAGVFRAVTSSDLISEPQTRHSYRLSIANSGFTVVRVEVRRYAETEWTTIWEAAPWSIPEKVK